MLILSRQFAESIAIGDEITVTVSEFRGPKIRLAIEAPPEISVHRYEIYEDIFRNLKHKGITPGQYTLSEHNPLAATLDEIRRLAGRMGDAERGVIHAAVGSILEGVKRGQVA